MEENFSNNDIKQPAGKAVSTAVSHDRNGIRANQHQHGLSRRLPWHARQALTLFVKTRCVDELAGPAALTTQILR